jgi:hypothetical protein
MGSIYQRCPTARCRNRRFEVLLTVDQGFTHQQNLTGRQIAVVILGSGQWPLLKPALDLIVSAVEGAKPGTITFVEIPRS